MGKSRVSCFFTHRVVEKNNCFTLPKVVQQEFVGEVGTFVFSDVEILQDAMYQNVFKSVDFSWSYSKK